ncbi:ornithine cyclodeaminase family protein, partial [Mesorhizobium sp. M7A.F.Ca.US.005.03.2.1]
MKPIYIDYLNALDIDALAMTDGEIIAAVEAGLVAQGKGQTVIE